MRDPSIYQHCGWFSLTKIIEDTTVGCSRLLNYCRVWQRWQRTPPSSLTLCGAVLCVAHSVYGSDEDHRYNAIVYVVL